MAIHIISTGQAIVGGHFGNLKHQNNISFSKNDCCKKIIVENENF